MKNLTSREIVDRLGLAGKNTLRLERATNIFREKLRKYISDENDIDNIFAYASDMCGESHYIGFMQGVGVAFTLLRETD